MRSGLVLARLDLGFLASCIRVPSAVAPPPPVPPVQPGFHTAHPSLSQAGPPNAGDCKCKQGSLTLGSAWTRLLSSQCLCSSTGPRKGPAGTALRFVHKLSWVQWDEQIALKVLVILWAVNSGRAAQQQGIQRDLEGCRPGDTSADLPRPEEPGEAVGGPGQLQKLPEGPQALAAEELMAVARNHRAEPLGAGPL
ncbi:hypothetical protein H920_10796 [Fukomys damarensis]|uniref:Uncharacterized protein n=1 Tax=Fukomys damarensis TaxID=885580 RepID=A0A091DY99_FUKDA|nr:hypothetical protein H920_10796 [Fukomys damarensis]